MCALECHHVLDLSFGTCCGAVVLADFGLHLLAIVLRGRTSLPIGHTTLLFLWDLPLANTQFFYKS